MEGPKYTIIHEDEDLLLVNKDSGLAVQNESDEPDLCDLLRESHSGLHLINRIDQQVSGLVLFAKNIHSAGVLSEDLMKHHIKKNYLALVEGIVLAEDDTLVHRLTKKNSKTYPDLTGKWCKMHFETLQRFDRYTLLHIDTETGRFHQIRAQLSAYGHPIKGDLKYGSRRSNKVAGINLHAYKMVLKHPQSKEILHFSVPLPDNPVWDFVIRNWTSKTIF